MCKEPIPRKREGDQGSAEIAESGFSLFIGKKCKNSRSEEVPRLECP